MPQLTSVGAIYWLHLAGLGSIQFNNVVNQAKSITISDTSLTSLEGINVDNVDTFDINNNRYLNEVNVNLQTVAQSLDISFNAQQVSASFPSLQWANNITFRDVSSISMPNITVVNASAGFINNTVNGLAFPQLTQIGGSLAIVSNDQLSNVSFPQLSTVGGGFQIANNTQLGSVLGFPKVKSVGGAIDFTGNFSSAQLPSLTLVKGGVDIESSSSKFNCSSWNQAHSDGDIQGDSYVCKAKSVSTSVAIHATSGASSGSGSASATAAASTTSSSKGGAVPLAMEYTSAFGALAAFVFQFV
ncbi:Ecm33p [Sugiyamaella lignohabitans]|uniref:Ecm33p n=1 Tax=Sugiyamaella lignohabitans TaxID=796027 RepID=A0A167DR01_9ASCO|nr:Ecm33p [Sugiyamaella lignohabitans]ANB13188.1 Ecm33p [Sugiyamaella lignohabitans]